MDAPQYTCSNCTIELVAQAAKRSLAFASLRRGLVLGMKTMAWWHGIDVRHTPVPNEQCRACLRFVKLELKQRSPSFRWLNERINPRFDGWLARLLDEEELHAAKSSAKARFG